MNITAFKRTLETFVDHPSNLDLDRGRLLVEIRDQVIEARVYDQDGAVWVEEPSADPCRGYRWLVDRIARIHLLADRILAYIPSEESFVTPRGSFLDQLDENPNEVDAAQPDATATLVNVLSRRPSGATTVLYLTSDAGEGKTTIINHVAREQARRFKKRETGWLLLPINLGGRPFLRFDDVVVGELVNRLRFQHLYYDAVLQLTRLGVLVPAFDGFEEMFVETSPGEAVSALGNFVQHLDSGGSALIAARKAYFEFHSFRTQARLFDAIGPHSVTFSRLALRRWRRGEFDAYCSRRGLADGPRLYQKVASQLGADHPLLTRAVLVEKLVDIAMELPSVGAVVDKIGRDPDQYFTQFVKTIVEREANKKWLDRSGEAATPFLSVDGHLDLLAYVALEMWLMRSDALSRDYLDLIADVYTSDCGLPPQVARQIRERLPDHSLLTGTPGTSKTLTFDHDDFRRFFLGRAVGRLLLEAEDKELFSTLNLGAIPREAADAACRFAMDARSGSEDAGQRLSEIGRQAPATSYAKENCGSLALRFIGLGRSHDEALEGLVFPPEAMREIRWEGLRFVDCQFRPSSLKGAEIIGCEFVGCRFHRLEAGAKIVRDTTCQDCEFDQWVEDNDVSLYNPAAVGRAVRSEGFTIKVSLQEQAEMDLEVRETDPDAKIAERALRIFMRATHINEAVFRQKLGQRGSRFFEHVLPKLIGRQILLEAPYEGAGKGRRFKLNVPMNRIAEVIPADQLTLDQLLQRLGELVR